MENLRNFDSNFSSTQRPSPIEENWSTGHLELQPYGYKDFGDSWIVERLLSSVHLNENPNPVIDPLNRWRQLESEFWSSCSLDSLGQRLVSPDRVYDTDEEKIYSILANGKFRVGSRASLDLWKPILLDTIARKITKAYPIEIVLPTLPFKDQNPLTTNHSIGEVDLGEYLLMAQVRDICASIKAVYPPGVQFYLVCDGLVYADIFGNGQYEDINNYRNRCWSIKEELGLRDTVHIIDMQWIINQEDRFSDIQNTIRTRLLELESQNNEVFLSMRSLRRGMLMNLSLGSSMDEVISYLDMDEAQLPQNIFETIYNAATNYASFLLTLQHLNVLPRAFPGALRATVHPKNAPQLPLHLVNRNSSVFPYNGIPLVSRSKYESSGSFRTSTRIMRYSQLFTEGDVSEDYIKGFQEPFCYLKN